MPEMVISRTPYFLLGRLSGARAGLEMPNASCKTIFKVFFFYTQVFILSCKPEYCKKNLSIKGIFWFKIL